jgi:hypothetical protein
MNYFITTKSLPYDLDDTLNYNYILQHTVVDCFTNYVDIINVYMLFAKNICTTNKTLYNYLLEKGISTINYIFKLMLLYTKNLDLTNHYCRQTIGYYLEFIEQNMQHEDYDKINYNNASRFSYSKTIDKLVKQYRKISYNELDDNTAELLFIVEEKEKENYSIMNTLIEVYNKLVVLSASAVGAGSSANVVGANAVGANAVDIQYLLHVATHELYSREKLDVLLAFINNFPFQCLDAVALNYIYCFCEHFKADLPSKDAIIQKLSSDASKIRLQKDTMEAYIGWVMV